MLLRRRRRTLLRRLSRTLPRRRDRTLPRRRRRTLLRRRDRTLPRRRRRTLPRRRDRTLLRRRDRTLLRRRRRGPPLCLLRHHRTLPRCRRDRTLLPDRRLRTSVRSSRFSAAAPRPSATRFSSAAFGLIPAPRRSILRTAISPPRSNATPPSWTLPSPGCTASRTRFKTRTGASPGHFDSFALLPSWRRPIPRTFDRCAFAKFPRRR